MCKMSHLYDPRTIYDPSTMPLVEGWEETNNCTFVRFHWVPTKAEQDAIDRHWRPLFYRHSLINSKMYLATTAGRGVPGWDPYLGYTEEQSEKRDYETGDGLYDNTLGVRIAQGRRVEPTGLADDPRLPERAEPEPRTDIVQMLRDAAARYEAGVRAQHAEMLVTHAAQKAGSWAQRAKLAGAPPPTLADARKAYQERLGGVAREDAQRSWWMPQPAVTPGIWHEWEIVEVERERARQKAIDDAEARADAYMKSRYPCWGGGT